MTRGVTPDSDTGRSFLCHLIDLSCIAKKLHHHVHLNSCSCSDLQWWALFLDDWNGIGILPLLCRQPASLEVTSNNSGSRGCGAYSDQKWFSFPWNKAWNGVHITVKELLPIVMAGFLWGKQWAGQHIMANCDNTAVVAIIKSGTGKDARACNFSAPYSSCQLILNSH